MQQKNYSPAQKFAVVEAYLRNHHRRGSVSDLARESGVSTALIGQWLEVMRNRADVTFRSRAPTKLPASARATIDHLQRRIAILEDRVAELQENERQGRTDFEQ